MLFFEDYSLGQSFEVPSISFSEQDIIDFGHAYDPRDIHIDVKTAKNSRFKGLIASGFQTMTATWAQWVKTGIDHDGVVCGMSIDKNIWHLPVYAGDVLTPVIYVEQMTDRPGKATGSIQFKMLVHNQNEDLVLTFLATVLVAKR